MIIETTVNAKSSTNAAIIAPTITPVSATKNV